MPPIPKSTRLKRLEGNPGKRRLPAGSEPIPLQGLPNCPSQLKGAARRAWKLLSEQLAAMNLDFQVDALALEGACVAYARAADADAVIQQKGPTFTTPNGYVQQRPEIGISTQNWKTFRAFCADFGLTPGGRARLHVEVSNQKPNELSASNELEYLLSLPE